MYCMMTVDLVLLVFEGLFELKKYFRAYLFKYNNISVYGNLIFEFVSGILNILCNVHYRCTQPHGQMADTLLYLYKEVLNT